MSKRNPPTEPIELKPMGTSAPPPPPPRHPETHAGGLGAAYRAAEEKARAAVHLQDGAVDAMAIWALGAAGWFAILAVPLLLFPRLLLFFAQAPPTSAFGVTGTAAYERDHYDALTPLEYFLCLALSVGLLAMALIALLGVVPSYEPPVVNPARKALLAILVGLTTIMSLVSWNTSSIGGLGTALGLGNTAVAVWGWWVIVFSGGWMPKKEKSRVPARFKRL